MMAVQSLPYLLPRPSLNLIRASRPMGHQLQIHSLHVLHSQTPSRFPFTREGGEGDAGAQTWGRAATSKKGSEVDIMRLQEGGESTGKMKLLRAGEGIKEEKCVVVEKAR